MTHSFPTRRSSDLGGRARYGKLSSALSTGYREPEYDVLREHLRGHTMSVVPIINGAAFFGEVTDSHWTTVTSIVKETKCSQQTILRLLIKLGHLDAGQQSTPVRYIKVDAANDVIERLTERITTEKVATILGLTRARAFPLARDGDRKSVV